MHSRTTEHGSAGGPAPTEFCTEGLGKVATAAAAAAAVADAK